MTIKRVVVPVYGRPVYMVDDDQEAKALRAKHRTVDQKSQVSEEGESHGYGNCCICGIAKPVVVMFVNRAKKHPGGILSTVTHESVHAAGQVLEIAGVNYGPGDDEQLAYVTDWIFGQWCSKLDDLLFK